MSFTASHHLSNNKFLPYLQTCATTLDPKSLSAQWLSVSGLVLSCLLTIQVITAGINSCSCWVRNKRLDDHNNNNNNNNNNNSQKQQKGGKILLSKKPKTDNISRFQKDKPITYIFLHIKCWIIQQSFHHTHQIDQ